MSWGGPFLHSRVDIYMEIHEEMPMDFFIHNNGNCMTARSFYGKAWFIKYAFQIYSINDENWKIDFFVIFNWNNHQLFWIIMCIFPSHFLSYGDIYHFYFNIIRNLKKLKIFKNLKPTENSRRWKNRHCCAEPAPARMAGRMIVVVLTIVGSSSSDFIAFRVHE